jgi:hypothetical protein
MKVATAICIFCLCFNYTMEQIPAKELPQEVTVSLLCPDKTALPPQKVARVQKSDEEWLKQLGPERFRILRTQGTERPFCGTLLDNKNRRLLMRGCELPCFSRQNSIPERVGPAFSPPLPRRTSSKFKTEAMGSFA